MDRAPVAMLPPTAPIARIASVQGRFHLLPPIANRDGHLSSRDSIHRGDPLNPDRTTRANKENNAMFWTKRVVIGDGERGLVYRNRRFEQLLAPGVYRWFDPMGRIEVRTFNIA
ncbi:MAG TPA: hypothetical protein VGE09_08105, partial [Pseudoxanthomonas sp.]